jgi:hypothetical protein
MDAINQAAGVDMTPEEAAKYKAWRAEQAAAERAALEKKGEFDTILSKERKEHQKALNAEKQNTAGVMDALREEKLGAMITSELVKRGVSDKALPAARRTILSGDIDGVRLDLKKQGEQWEPELRDRAGVVAADGEGGDMSRDQFFDRFKEGNPFFFKSEVAPGSGAPQSGGGRPPSGQPTDVAAALSGDAGLEAYAKATGRNLDEMMRR